MLLFSCHHRVDLNFILFFKLRTVNNCQKHLHPTAADFIWSIFPFHIIQLIAAFSSGTEHVAERLCSTHQNQKSARFQALVTDGGSLAASQRGKGVKISLLFPPASLTAAAFPAWTGSTHVVSCDDQLDHILGVRVQDFHCGSRYERSEILQKDGMELAAWEWRIKLWDFANLTVKSAYLVDDIQLFCHCKDKEDVIFCQLFSQKCQRGIIL